LRNSGKILFDVLEADLAESFSHHGAGTRRCYTGTEVLSYSPDIGSRLSV